jgi:transforming growth factor-beta-induced protein
MRHVLVAATLMIALSTLALADDFRPIFHPPTIGIVEALEQDPDNFSTLIGLLRKADLKELRDAKASYTILAPTNGAFAKLSPEYFTKLTNDPAKLRQFLLAHLLSGKVMFMQMFAPDKAEVAKKNVTESLKTADGGLAYFVCNEHPVDPANEHHPLINKKARVLKSDIEGKYSVIHVIDTVLVP